MPEEHTQAPQPQRIATPDIVEKGSRGADVFPAADPTAIQAVMSGPGPFAPSPEVGTPQALDAPQESSD